MGTCKCGFSRDEEKNCDGTHKVVKSVKEEAKQKIINNINEELEKTYPPIDDEEFHTVGVVKAIINHIEEMNI